MKKFSKEDIINLKKESIDYYYSRSWYNTYEKIQPIFTEILHDTFILKIFVTSGVYSREIGASSVLSFLQKLQSVVNIDDLQYLHLGSIYTLWKSNEFAQTFQVCFNLLSKHPKSAEGWYIMSKLYIEYQDYEKALHSILICIKLNPKNSNYYQRYSEILFYTKKYKESLQFLIFSMRFASNEKLNKLRMKVLLVNHQNETIEQVLERFDDIILKYQIDRKSHLWIKSLYILYKSEKSMFQNAFNWIEESILSSGRRISLYKLRILNYFSIRLKNWSKVIETSNSILKQAPTTDSNTNLYIVTAKYHLNQVNIQECLQLKQDESNINVLFDSIFVSGKVLFKEKQFDNVLILMKKSLDIISQLNQNESIFLSIYPKKTIEIECNYLIGKSLNSKERIYYFKKCIDLDPTNIDYWTDYIESIETYYSKNDQIYFTSIYRYSQLISDTKIDTKIKLKYWNEVYECSKLNFDENIKLESLTNILQMKYDPIKEKQLIELLMKHSKRDKISSYFWDKYLLTKNPIDLVSYSLSFL